jgi:hypothetical protein
MASSSNNVPGVPDDISNDPPASYSEDISHNEEKAPFEFSPCLVQQLKASIDALNAQIAAEARDRENSKTGPEATHSNDQNIQTPVYNGPWISRPIKIVASENPGSRSCSGPAKTNSEKLYDPASPDFYAISEDQKIQEEARAITLERRKRANGSSEHASVEDQKHAR